MWLIIPEKDLAAYKMPMFVFLYYFYFIYELEGESNARIRRFY